MGDSTALIHIDVVAGGATCCSELIRDVTIWLCGRDGMSSRSEILRSRGSHRDPSGSLVLRATDIVQRDMIEPGLRVSPRTVSETLLCTYLPLECGEDGLLVTAYGYESRILT